MSKNQILLITLLVTIVAATSGYFYVRNASIAARKLVIDSPVKATPEPDVKILEERLKKISAEVIERDFRMRLSNGDSREKIEQILKEKNMMFSFDQFWRRYEVCVNPGERRAEMVKIVDIGLDGSNRLSSIKVRDGSPSSP